MLQLLDSTDLIVNVDETWINETDFRSKNGEKEALQTVCLPKASV
jgi:hypothetical protein